MRRKIGLLLISLSLLGLPFTRYSDFITTIILEAALLGGFALIRERIPLERA